ncbi:M23 family metallopeptidase [Algoriphagus chordae]|nr:M23 family metallopeptidase [Algoriphagus chordae]
MMPQVANVQATPQHSDSEDPTQNEVGTGQVGKKRDEVMIDVGYGQKVSSRDIQGEDYIGDFETRGGSTKNKSEVLDSPVGNARVSSAFKSTRTCEKCSNTHGGTDYAVSIGTNVSVTASGKVVKAYNSKTYGNTVIVDHGPSSDSNGNVYTLYAHGNSIPEKEGQPVSVGDLILVSGNTGRNTTGPHLHYEVIVTKHTPFETACFGNLNIRFAPTDLKYFLGK